MTAVAAEQVGNDYEQRATQWFIVSDLGLTAYSGHDGVDVFIHSLASAAPLEAVEVRLVARNNEVLATLVTDKNGRVHFPAGLTRGDGGLVPAAIVASGKGDYAFLSAQGARLRSLRPRRRRPAGAGRARRLCLYRARRLPQRRDRPCHQPAARPARQCRRPGGADAGDGAPGRRRIPPRAGRRPGPRRPQLGSAAGRLRHDRHLARARLHRPQAPAGRRRHLHGRGLRARPRRIRPDHRGQIDPARRPGRKSSSTAASSMARPPPVSTCKAR